MGTAGGAPPFANTSGRGYLQGPPRSRGKHKHDVRCDESPNVLKGRWLHQQELLRGGASPDIGRTEGPLGWVGTESPLYSAAQLGHAEVVEALLDHRPRPDLNVGLTVRNPQNATQPTISRPFFAPFAPFFRCCFALPGFLARENGRRLA